eukprot:TRINITY_DN114_c0_g1_i3.p1 TRINITY_DN114_c0_g1~~TRINITY_DN114_c0_g1_i3.p1  ORF type:complete len:104 (+),score=13.36 TRINITY_DN114_c0_g1_i3:77-388(+)
MIPNPFHNNSSAEFRRMRHTPEGGQETLFKINSTNPRAVNNKGICAAGLIPVFRINGQSFAIFQDTLSRARSYLDSIGGKISETDVNWRYAIRKKVSSSPVEE